MPLDGDFGKLLQWQAALREIGSPRFSFGVASEQADVAIGLVAEGFGRESDPYGKPWAPKKRPDGRRTLRGKTNRLVKWRKTFVNQHGYGIASAAPYARHHQRGTSRMVARKMVPDARIPRRWSSAFSAVFHKRVNRALRRQ
jgi:hypothetical protein